MADEVKSISPIISDAPKNLLDFFSDPGFVTIIGFIALLLGLCLIAIVPVVASIYMYFTGGVVGLVGGHAWTDSQKTRFMCEKKEDN